MSKGLNALGKLTGTQNLTMYEQNECLKIIEEELKENEETNSKLDNLFESLGIESKEDLIKKLKALEVIKGAVKNSCLFDDIRIERTIKRGVVMRLTHKHKYKKDSQRFVFDMKDYRKACQKLGRYEDIEDELGIDLITLYKLFKAEKVFSFSNCGVWEVSNNGINLYSKTIKIWNGVCGIEYPLSEYGNWFALTREELL